MADDKLVDTLEELAAQPADDDVLYVVDVSEGEASKKDKHIEVSNLLLGPTTDIATNATAIALNTTHRGSDGSDHSKVTDNETAIALNTTHRSSVGTDHGYIDQDLQTTASPTFAGLDLTEGNMTSVGEVDLDLIRADAADGSVTIELDDAAGADLIVGNNSALVVEGDNDRVGIGTAAPRAALDVRDVLYLGTTGVSHGVINSDANLIINIDADNGSTTNVLEIAKDRTGATGGTVLVTVKENGYMGIGIVPSYPLDISGSARVSSTLIVGNEVNTAAGGPTDPAYTFTGGLTTGMYYVAANHLGFSAGGVEAMRIQSGGNVGIGTVPTAKLHVDQTSSTGAQPVLLLDQADVDEDYLKIVGTSDTSADRALVDAANFPNIGAVAGYLKVNVQDDQATNPIADGDYYVPFYAVPTA